MNDNYIGDIEQVKHFRPIISLKEVVFQLNDSGNPICDLQDYHDQVLNMLPQITRLDGRSIYELGIEFKS